MKDTKPLETEPVYFHNCPVLGKDTRLVRALKASRDDDPVILYYHHSCPFCPATSGEKEYAPGVTPLADGSYSVDLTKAERLR